jgi:hypothetical protein
LVCVNPLEIDIENPCQADEEGKQTVLLPSLESLESLAG